MTKAECLMNDEGLMSNDELTNPLNVFAAFGYWAIRFSLGLRHSLDIRH